MADTLDFTIKGDGTIELRWVNVVTFRGQSETRYHREAREAGADISDLPPDAQAAITAWRGAQG